MLSRITRRFWAAIDDERTSLYEWVLYVILMSAGAFYLCIAHSPPGALQASLAWFSFELWRWMNLVGPGACLLGKVLRRTEQAYAGMLLQFAGNAITSGAVIAYTLSAWAMWGRGAYAGFLGSFISIGVVFLTLRAARRLREVERHL